MSFPPCKHCGATYAEGQIGTVHREDCPSLPQNRTHRFEAEELLSNLEGAFDVPPGIRLVYATRALVHAVPSLKEPPRV